MTKEQVIELLKFYPQIGQEIKMYTEMLEQIEDNWGVSCVVYGGNSVHSKSKTDITAVKAEKLAKSGDGDIMREIEMHINYLKTLQSEMFNEFKRLPYYEKQVIYHYYIDRKQWAWIVKKLNYSERQCRNKRNNALVILCGYFEENPNIKYKLNYTA